LRGSDTCTALGMTARSSSPVLALCRDLIDAGHNPGEPLEAWRGGTLCLRIRAIGVAAGLKINARGTGFVPCAVRAGSPTRRPGKADSGGAP
jgi:hypothetical protein